MEAQNIDNVSRGFFIRDASYGFESLDGFVVSYVAESESWTHTSIAISTFDFLPGATDQDLTSIKSNNLWDCIVNIDPAPTPLWNEFTCSRVIPEESDYETQQIRYMPKIVMDIWGYRWDGIAVSAWEYGGQITLDNASSLYIGIASLAFSIMYF